MSEKSEDRSISELRDAVADLKQAVIDFRDVRATTWQMPMPSPALPAEAIDWNFTTFEKFINQRFNDLTALLLERYQAQQTGLAAALAAAEKAVNAALIAAEKAVDKAEGAQQLRNEAQNEFRKSLNDLSALMWTIKEGSAAVEALRREYLTGHTPLVDRIALMWTIKEGNAAVEALRREYLTGHTPLVDRITAVEAGKVGSQRVDSMEMRLTELATDHANMQGRIWAIGAVWAALVMAVSIGVRFIGH